MEVIFTFSGTSHAIAAETILLDRGFDVRVMPLPPVIQAGCGLCLRLDEIQAAKGRHCLQEASIQISACYTRQVAAGKSQYTLWEE